MSRKTDLSSLVLLALVPALAGAQPRDIVIGGSEVWRVSEGPRFIDGLVTVEDSASLTIEAGVAVRFAGDFRSGIKVKGRLEVSGTAERPVAMGLDPAVADIRGASWGGIVVDGERGGVVMRDARLSRAVTAVQVLNGSATLESVFIRDSGTAASASGPSAHLQIRGGEFTRNSFGVDAFGGATASANGVLFRRNRTAISSRGAPLVLGSNSFDGNQFTVVSDQPRRISGSGNRLVARDLARDADVETLLSPSAGATVSGVIASDTTWSASQSPMLVAGDIEIAEGATLTIQPGVIVRFEAGGGSGLTVKGGLVVAGTQANPVYMTSSLDPGTHVTRFPLWMSGQGPRAGDWKGIRLAGSGSSLSVEYATIRFAHTAVSSGESGRVSLSRATLRDNYVGLRADGRGAVMGADDSFVLNGMGVQSSLPDGGLTRPEFTANVVAAGGPVQSACRSAESACRNGSMAAARTLPVAPLLSSPALVNLMPSFAAVPAGWTTFGYEPAAFSIPASPAYGRAAELQIRIDQAQGYSNRPSSFQDQSYGYQGRAHSIAGVGAGDTLSADLYVNSALGDASAGNAASYMWAVGSNASGEADFALIGFTNSVGHGEFTVWDDGLSTWTDLSNTVRYDDWNTVAIQFTGSSFEYYLNGVKVYSMENAYASTRMSATVIDAVNFFDPTTPFTGRNYTVTWSDTPTAADLTISKAHSGNFVQAQTGAVYTILVSNSGGVATSGVVTVQDALPAGLTATAMDGTGWACSTGSLSCTRSDALVPGGSYPAITVTVNVSAIAPVLLTNVVTVQGGGEQNAANDTAGDPTTIIPLPPFSVSLNEDKTAYAIGQTVTFSGNVVAVGGTPASGASVILNLVEGSATHTLNAVSGADGSFNATYQPLAAEAGTFAVTATAAAGGGVVSATSSFRVIGLQLSTASATLDLVIGTSASPALTILNLGNAALNAVNITIAGGGATQVTGKLLLSGVPSALAAGASAGFSLTLNAATGTAPAGPVVFTVTATGIDAISGVAAAQTVTITVSLHPATSSAVISPLNATLGVNPGDSSVQQYTVRNDGYVAISGANVTLSSPPNWIALEGASIGQVNPGQSASFRIIAAPPAGTTPGTYLVPFTVSGASAAAPGTLAVNVTGDTTGIAPFNVSDDLGTFVSGATVTLTGKVNAAQIYQGATDASGNVTLTGVLAGDYNYVVAAPRHSPATGSVRVSAGGSAQKLAQLRPRDSVAPPPTPVAVVLKFDAVTLTFTVTPTTITDVYDTQLQVLYSTYLVKPVLQVIPVSVNCSFYPQSVPVRCTQLQITNLHPTSTVTDITIDASQLDLGTSPGQRFQAFLGGIGGANVLHIGDLQGQHVSGTNTATVTLYTTVSPGNLATRDLGNITVSGGYTYSTAGGVVADSTTSTPVPVRYTYPTDVLCDSINLIHDANVDANDLRSLDSSYSYSCSSGRPGVSGTFVSTAAQPFGGHSLVAFAQVHSSPATSPQSKSDYSTILTNTPLWRTSFSPGGFPGGLHDTASYSTTAGDAARCAGTLISCLKANLSAVLSHPTYVGFVTQWSDRTSGPLAGPDGYKIPVNIYQIPVIPPPPHGGCDLLCGISFNWGPPEPLPVCPAMGCPIPSPIPQGGQILVEIDLKQSFERQAFNATLGIAPAVPLSNVQTTLAIRDASSQDASGQFTIIVFSDPQGATTGGTVSGTEQLRWQLIPKAGAGGASGLQYTVTASMSYSISGTTSTVTTNAVSITVLPQPRLVATYSVPYVVVASKNAKIGISVENSGGGPAHNFSVSAAQPKIVSNVNNLPVGFSIAGSSSTPNGSTFEDGVTTINFGDILSNTTAAGYFALQATSRGYIVDATATMMEEDYLGVTLDPLLTAAPNVLFIPAVGGNVSASGGPPNGLVVTLSQGGIPKGSDITDSAGNYYISDLAPGQYQLTVATASGTALPAQAVLCSETIPASCSLVTSDTPVSSRTITVLGDSSTAFVDLNVSLPPAGPVTIHVGTAPAGLSFTVDGIAYTSAQTFTWIAGSPHSISTIQSQQAGPGTRYIFGTWSNGGSGPSQQFNAPVAPATYTATFTAQYLLTTSVSPAAGGAINTNPTYYNAGTQLSIIASANAGYQFASFSGDLTGTVSPAILTMNGPKAVTANFSPIAPLLTTAITARSGNANARSWTITFTNNGTGVGNSTRVTSLSLTPVGTPGCTVAPRITTPASTITVASPLIAGDIGPVGSAAGSASATVVIDFSGCQALTKFTVNIGYSANSGAYVNTATFNNQFR